VDIEPEVAAAFPGNELLSGIAMVGVGRSAPGVVHHQTAGSPRLGRYPQGVTAAAEQLAYQFSEGGIACSLTEQVVGARWQKALWNASLNPISIMGAVLDTTHMLGTPEARDFVRRTMQEVSAVATAAGHAPPAGLIEQLIEVTAAMPPYKTSMAQDYESGRAMEIEAILDNTLRVARRLDVATPVLDSLHALARMIEAKTGGA
jgi:2-dehydropantoate 2-reductase